MDHTIDKECSKRTVSSVSVRRFHRIEFQLNTQLIIEEYLLLRKIWNLGSAIKLHMWSLLPQWVTSLWNFMCNMHRR